MKFYFIRHPETLANKKGLIYGSGDYDYTDKGREMVDAVPEILDAYSFDRIFTSPLGRAKKLADAIGKHRNIPVTVDERIKEQNFGILEDVPYMDAHIKYPDIVKRLFGDIDNYRVPGGENTNEVIARAADFLDELKNEEGAVLIVTHSMFLHSAMSYLLNIPRNDMWHFKIDPCMIVRIDYRNNFGVLKEMIPYEETDSMYIVNIENSEKLW